MTESAVSGIGQELAAARAARGLALADVAQQLKFAPRQLEALEQERFEALPGATFARGMVRSYARLLKLDPEPLLTRIAGRCEVPDANRLAARYHQPVPFSDSARRSTFVYLGISAGVLVLVGAVAYEWHQERTAAAKARAPARVASVAKAALPEAKPQPVAAVEVLPEKTEVAVPAVPEKAKVVAAGHRMVVRTEGEAWIEIRDSADRTLISSLNPPGSERVVRGKPPYSLVIGNASQVSITYDEKPVDLARYTRQDVARFTLP